MIYLIVLLALLWFFLMSISRYPKRRDARLHFCDQGMEGHNRRVAEFYGEDYDEELAKIADLEARVESGELERVSINF